MVPYPDLEPINITGLPDSLVAGYPIPVSFTVGNTGLAPAQGTTWKDRIYVSVNPSFDIEQSTFVKEIDRLQSLGEEGTYTVETDIIFPMLSLMVPGLDSFSNVYVFLITDLEDNIYEHGAYNNNNILVSSPVFVTCI